MINLKEYCFLVLYLVCGTYGASQSDKNFNNLKRAVDTYNYPQPQVQFQENAKKTLIEMIKSVSPPSGQGRYLPPSPTAATNAGGKLPPITVTFNSYEPPASSGQNKPATTPAPSAPAAPAAGAAPATSSTTTQKKRPSGGLGGFKYYGGSGSSSSSSSSNSDSSAAAASAASSAPAAAPAPAKSVTIEAAPDKPKATGYNYPSPKSNRKPSKKEQKLADSKPEESAQGYHYDVGPGVLASNVQTFGSGSSGGMMGLSYMRQSSPFYSYHVMLD